MDKEILKIAKDDISRIYGDISDLNEEVQNTIANIYYNAVLINNNPVGYEFANGISGFRKTIQDTAFYTNALEHLPIIISNIRETMSDGNEEGINMLNQVTLFVFKYRIKGAMSKPLFLLNILKLFSKKNVNEIPNLHKELFF